MDYDYDEDLNENLFFQYLQNENYDLFEKSTYEGWIICVPRSGSLSKAPLSGRDLLSHILIPSDELPETHFTSLSGEEVKIINRVINVSSLSCSTNVLFEETFYTSDSLKYKVLCIESPLERVPNESSAPVVVTVHSLRDSIDLLWRETSKTVLEGIDEEIKTFLRQCVDLESKTLKEQRILIGTLYDQCLHLALNSHVMNDRHILDNLKVSVEALIHHGVYPRLMAGIVKNTAGEDAKLNKITRNLSDIQLLDLDVRMDLHHGVPKARAELTRIEKFSTILGKVNCFRRTFVAISKQDSINGEGCAIAADDLLPTLIFLVIKSGIPNWIAHLTFMKEFSFALSKHHIDQQSFLVTSFEAAVEHVRNGSVTFNPESIGEINGNRFDKDQTKLSLLFDMAKVDNLEEVMKILTLKDELSDGSFLTQNLCHPLCCCEKCENEVSRTLRFEAPSVDSCDDKGCTALHVAAKSGHPRIVDYLLAENAKVNLQDIKGRTPLHYAASMGHQNAVLLLLHANSKLTVQDSEGNTPLHYACLNGHDCCAKAIVYFAEHSGHRININSKNNLGDSALHFAAKWGYKDIVAILLECGADPNLENLRKKTPMDWAHDLDIFNLLNKYQYIKTKGSTTQRTLDLYDEDTLKQSHRLGVRPSSTNDIRKVERLLRAVSYGDTRLACFYLGIDPGSQSSDCHSCHPLCPCRKQPSTTTDDMKDKDCLNVNSCSSDGLTPLHVAATYGRTELVRLLLEAGASVNILTSQNGLTPLQLACQNERQKAAKALLDSGGCDINYQDATGNTALHYACHSSSSSLVELLMKYEPEINLKNNQGKTPLVEAQDVLSLSLVQLLTRPT